MKFTLANALAEKQAQCQLAAARPIAEKLRMLESLRDRDAQIKRAVEKANPMRRGGLQENLMATPVRLNSASPHLLRLAFRRTC